MATSTSTRDTVYIALGSNLGDRAGNLHRAIAALKQVNFLCLHSVLSICYNGSIMTSISYFLCPLQHDVGVLEGTSGLYESKAQYVTDQPDFINAVCRLRTKMEPEAMLQSLKRIEKDLGRVPSQR